MKIRLNKENKMEDKGETKPTRKSRKVNVKEFKKVVKQYLEECEEKNKVPFLQELAKRLGLHRDTLRGYENSSVYAPYIKSLKISTESALLRRVADSGRPIGSMFLLKSIYGYQEGQKLDITSNGETVGVVALPANPDQKTA